MSHVSAALGAYVSHVAWSIARNWSWAALFVGIVSTLIGVYTAFALGRIQDHRNRAREAVDTLGGLVEEVLDSYGWLTAINNSFATLDQETLLKSWPFSVEFLALRIDPGPIRSFRATSLVGALPRNVRRSINKYVEAILAVVNGGQVKRSTDLMFLMLQNHTGLTERQREIALNVANETSYRAAWVANWKAIEATESLLSDINLLVDGGHFRERMDDIVAKAGHSRKEPPKWPPLGMGDPPSPSAV